MGYVIGERIMLRDYRESDLTSMRKWVNDPETIKTLSSTFTKVQTEQSTSSFLNAILSGNMQGHFFVIADKSTQEYLGQIDLFKVDAISRNAEVGLVVAPWAWHKGYAREALSLILRFAFEQINLHRVCLEVYAPNARARACYAACGFKEEGVLREHVYSCGQYIDMVQMGILRREWAQMHHNKG